ncbi:MAG TPA: hypothetical protein VIV11_18320 [Kofleriaceae bacterium]
MRKISAVLFIVATACGNDSTVSPDAAPQPDGPPDAAPDAFVRLPDFSCMGNSAPATAPADVTITGGGAPAQMLYATTDLQYTPPTTITAVPVENAKIAGFRTGTAAQQGTDNTNATGDWSFMMAGVTPIDGYLTATKTGHRNYRFYPPSPLAMDTTVPPLLLLNNETFNLLVQFSQKDQEAGNGTVGLAVLDCANMPITGAMISVKQGGTEYADDAHVYSLDQFQAGLYFIFNVPPGVTTVTATYNGMALRAHDIAVLAATTSTTAVRPGF